MKKVIATVAAFLLVGSLTTMNAQTEPKKEEKKEHKAEKKGEKKAEKSEKKAAEKPKN
jgi:hypothetical protein